MTATNLKSADLKLFRTYDAPLDAVWEAWTDKDKIAQWWGPRGFTITTHSRDLRSGGTWKYTMHGPDGVDYENCTRYITVQDKNKLVYEHGAIEGGKPLFVATVVFAERDGKTEMDMTMTFPSPEAAQTTRGFIKKAGGDATWDRLAEFLASEIDGKEIFVVNRSFDCAIEKMWDAWTNPNQAEEWRSPPGHTIHYRHADVREGGDCFYEMSDGKIKFYGKGQYKVLRKPELFVYEQQFCDENGKACRHPFAPAWPLNMHNTITLAKEPNEQTRVTVRWEPVGDLTADEKAEFVSGKAGCTQGWAGSFDKLDAFLAD